MTLAQVCVSQHESDTCVRREPPTRCVKDRSTFTESVGLLVERRKVCVGGHEFRLLTDESVVDLLGVQILALPGKRPRFVYKPNES